MQRDNLFAIILKNFKLKEKFARQLYLRSQSGFFFFVAQSRDIVPLKDTDLEKAFYDLPHYGTVNVAYKWIIHAFMI
jgi:hypothetical protein